MAELGIASAGFGIASFAVQVFSSINALKATYRYNQRNAPEKLKDITNRLEFLKLTLESLQSFEGNPLVDHAIQSCQSTFDDVGKDLSLLLEKVQRKPPNKKIDWKSVRLRLSSQLSGKIRDEIDEICSKLLWLNSMLNVSSSVYLMTPIPPENRTQKSINTLEPSGSLLDNVDNPADGSNVQPGDTDKLMTDSVLLRPLVPSIGQKTPCNLRHCHCSCHLTENSLGRYWGFEYTPLSVMLGKCDYKGCDTKNIRWKFRFTLNKLKIPWAFLMDFELMLGAGTYSLRPALILQQVVYYTSPGFVALWKCENFFMSLPEAQRELRELNRLPSPLRQHINPGGENYIQVLLAHGPWFNEADQFALLFLFVNEFGMKLENEDHKFLTQCASWIGEGRHLDLLDIVLELGFDPTAVDSPLFQDWPSACSPNWISEMYTPDPFFLEYLATIAKENPGFGGSTALQNAVLCGSTATTTRLLSDVNGLESHRNFLGQTTLHLAVCNSQLFTMILDAGHDMDVIDRWGITPLMYAAAMGIEDVVILLISKGANMTARATHPNRDFMHYAAVRGHWDLILKSLTTIQSYYSEYYFQRYVYKAILLLLSKNLGLGDSREKYFVTLIGLCEDVNFVFGDFCRSTEGNNLMHYVKTKKEFQALIRQGFHDFNKPNSDGNLPLYSIVRKSSNLDLIRCCLDNGTDINHINHSDRTVIFELLGRLVNLDSTTWDNVDSIKLCLDRGLDISHTDSCICACSFNGCNTSSAFHTSFTDMYWRSRLDFIWAFEWLSIVEEFCGYEDAKTVLLSFIRRTCFDSLELTHVCCHGGKGLDSIWPKYSRPNPEGAQEILEILDEEQELIQILEDEMQGYSSKDLDELRSEWMILLKQRYDKAAADTQTRSEIRREASNETYVIDYKKDTYCYEVVVNLDKCRYRLPDVMSEYAFWLQHEYLRTSDHANNTLVKEGWYKRRTEWLAELICVMGTSNQKMKQVMEKIHVADEIGFENIDVKAIVDQFLTSMRLVETGFAR